MIPTTPTVPPDNAHKVAKNFVWSALEGAAAIAGMMFITVASARVIGPTKLGYFNLVFWLTNMTGLIASFGLPMTTFKYMSEYLGAGKPGSAHAVYRYSMKLQAAISLGVVAVASGLVFTVGRSDYRLISFFLVLSVVPQMLTFIPSQANKAAENLSANLRGSLIGEAINVVAVGLSLLLGWDLVGIAIGVFLFRAVELFAKAIPVQRRLRTFPIEPLSQDARKRMFRFSGLSTGLMLLQVIVWNRSDMLFLNWFNPDIRQVTFFSISFSLTERLVSIPQAFGTAVGVTQMVEYGRDRRRLLRTTSIAGTYILMGALPLLVGSACLSGPIVRLIYGSQYLPAISVFTIIAIFAIPKAVLVPAQTLLYSMEDLKFLLVYGCLCGVTDVALDLFLIPSHGATGAAVANGLAQTLASAGIWWRACSRHQVHLQVPALLKLLAATALMSAAVRVVTLAHLPAVGTLFVGASVGAVVFVISLRLVTALQEDDRKRLLQVGRKVPAMVRPFLARLIDFVVPPAAQVPVPGGEPSV